LFDLTSVFSNIHKICLALLHTTTGCFAGRKVFRNGAEMLVYGGWWCECQTVAVENKREFKLTLIICPSLSAQISAIYCLVFIHYSERSLTTLFFPNTVFNGLPVMTWNYF